MATTTTSDEKTRSSYGDPLRRAKGLGPYQRFPERSSWTEWEEYRREDGTVYHSIRDASRWAGSHARGEWRTVEGPAPFKGGEQR